jgi:predicted AAA+ superfamily ATPase
MKIIHIMNSQPQYLPRYLSRFISTALTSSPVVVITGARQTGKNTLVQHLAERESRLYDSLDDIDTLDLAGSDPDALVNRKGPICFDEVQRSPSLLLSVKRAVDKHRTAGRFILTGSANLLLMKRVSESLAGRAAYFALLPFSRREVLGTGTVGIWQDFFDLPAAQWEERCRAQHAVAEDWRDAAMRGGYPVPALHLAKPADRALWFTSYTRTYLERDLQDLGGVSSLVDFRRLMRAICLRLGNIVNQTELARDIGLSQPTVHRHLDILEVSHQLVRLPPYSVNRTKRLIKSPKAYWTDTALALHLSGENEPRGSHLENMILCDLLAWQGSGEGQELFYWRTTTGEEVDLVVERGRKCLPIEVKTVKKPQLADARHLLAFRNEYAKASLPGLVIHTGNEVRWLTDGVFAVPWWMVV